MLLVITLFAMPAYAQDHPVTLGTSPTVLSIPNTFRVLAIDNEAATGGNAIACAFYGSTPSLNSAGSWTIMPGDTRVWAGAATPSGPTTCVAGGTGTPVTVEALQ